jgi:hypothetical protein
MSLAAMSVYTEGLDYADVKEDLSKKGKKATAKK